MLETLLGLYLASVLSVAYVAYTIVRATNPPNPGRNHLINTLASFVWPVIPFVMVFMLWRKSK